MNSTLIFFAEKISNNLFYKIGLALVIGIFLLNFNTFYWADDFLIMSDLRNLPVYKFCLNGYMTWDGRMISLGVFLQASFLKYFQVNLITFIWNCFFFLSCHNFFKIIVLESDLKFNSKKQINAFLLGFSIILWIGCYRHISETIYWATGGGYTFVLWLSSVWLLMYYKTDFKSITKIYKFLFLVFTFVLGASTQNLTISIILFLLITIANKHLQKKPVAYDYLMLFFLIVGMGVLFAAPGNFLRLKTGGHQKFDFEVVTLILNYISVLKKYSWGSIVFIVFAMSVASILIPVKQLKLRALFKVNINKEQILFLLKKYQWLLMALSTITPFILTPGFSAMRTSIFFMFFIAVFFAVTLVKIIQRKELLDTTNPRIGLFKISILLFYLTVGSLILFNLKEGYTLRKQISERYEVLNKSRGKKIVITKIEQNKFAFCYKFTDFPTDEKESNKNWVFDNYKAYFGTNEILIK